MMMKSKKGLAPMLIIGIFLISLLVLYTLLFIPIPAFTKIRILINFFLVGILFILIQALFIFLYFELGKYVVKGFSLLRTKITGWNKQINKLIYTHS